MMPRGAACAGFLVDARTAIGRIPMPAGLLDDAERRACERIASPMRRWELATGRTLAKHAIARICDIDPATVRLSAPGSGRPRIVSMPSGRLDLSIAHSSGVVFMAVARGARVGVDVQEVPPFELRTARRALRESEYASLVALPRSHRAEAFAALWVVKEATAKALGRALPQLRSTWTAPEPGRHVRSELVAVSPGVLGAIVLAGRRAPLPPIGRVYRVNAASLGTRGLDVDESVA